MPELDPDIFAECEALLLNFDKILNKEFGEEYMLRESLSFALQLFPSSKTLVAAVKETKGISKYYRFYSEVSFGYYH